jgi:signal transduction histidine kinase
MGDRAADADHGDPAPRPSPRSDDASSRFRRRLLVALVGFVFAWTVVVAVVAAVATGFFGDLGLPTNAEGRPRGLMVVGASAVLVVAVVTIVYRRVSGPVSDLLRAVGQVAIGDYEGVDVAVRGFRELRTLASTFNEMAGRLAANEEQRRRFLADITHELRNPLAVLQSEIEAQLDGVHPRDDEHLSSLLEETRRLGYLVDDLHTLALSESGRLVLQREAVSLGVLVADVAARHDALARQRGVAVTATIVAGLPTVWADPDRVRQVLDNLLTNAIRHSPAGGEVEVAVTMLADVGDRIELCCRVSDAGPGFPEEQLHLVFERFTRAGDSKGSGLGLSIVHELVRAHGGTIEASNASAGGGACVTFTLPV